IQKMVWPMMAVGLAISHYQRSVASSERLKGVLRQESDVPDPVHPAGPEELPANPGLGGPYRSRGSIEYRRLSFSFPGATHPALRDVDLRVEPGSRIALVGMVGSGKSAMLSLLPRLYPVADGMLYVDEVDVNRWP